MIDKLKQIWAWIAGIAAVVLGVFAYLFVRKNDTINTLQTKLDTANTEKQSDIVEMQIQQQKQEIAADDKQHAQLDQLLADNEAKRAQIQQDAKNLKNPNDIAKYWENN